MKKIIKLTICILILLGLSLLVFSIVKADGSIGTSVIQANNGYMEADTIYGFQTTATGSGTSTSITWYLQKATSGTSNVLLGLYADSGSNTPAARLGSCGPVVATTTYQYLNCSIAGINIVNGTKYWIAYLTETGNVNMKYGASAPSTYEKISSYASGMPNPWGTAGSADGNIAPSTAYVNYTTTVADTTKPKYTKISTNATNSTLQNQVVHLNITNVTDETGAGQIWYGKLNGTYFNSTPANWVSGQDYKFNITVTEKAGTDVNLTAYFNDSSGNLNTTNVWTGFTVASATTCATCNINCADQCVITSDLNCAGGAFTAYGAGQITFNSAAITNYNNKIFGDGVNACGIVCNGGGKCW